MKKCLFFLLLVACGLQQTACAAESVRTKRGRDNGPEGEAKRPKKALVSALLKTIYDNDQDKFFKVREEIGDQFNDDPSLVTSLLAEAIAYERPNMVAELKKDFIELRLEDEENIMQRLKAGSREQWRRSRTGEAYEADQVLWNAGGDYARQDELVSRVPVRAIVPAGAIT